MADDVCDCMSLTGSRRPLNHYPVMFFQAFYNGNLLVVVREWEEKSGILLDRLTRRTLADLPSEAT